MTLSRILAFIVKKWPYGVVLLCMVFYTRIQHQAPRQPDPASGHVFRVIAPKGRRVARHVMYLTSTERSLYYGSLIVGAVSLFGILGNAYIQKRNRYNASL